MQHKFIFVFIRYFNAAILSVKSCQKWGRGGGCLWKGGLKPSANYDAYFITFYKPSYGISCLSKNVAIIIIVSLCSCSNSLSISWLNTSITSFLSLKADKSSNWERSLFLKTSVMCSCFQSYTKLGQVCAIPFYQI